MSNEIINTVNTVIYTVGILLLILGLVFIIITAKTKHIQYMSESFVNTVIVWVIIDVAYIISGVAWCIVLMII